MHKITLNYNISFLLILIAGDLLQAFVLAAESHPPGIGMVSSLKTALWFLLAFCVLPQDHLVPGHNLPAAVDPEEPAELREYCDFWILYSILTDPDLQFDPPAELEMWQELWFDFNHLIPDNCLEELQEHFQHFCRKNDIFRDFFSQEE